MTGAPYRVTESRQSFQSRVFTVHTDLVTTPQGQTAARDYIQHIGSVAVVAIDEQGQVVLIRQYRHPVREVLWELPAGLRDVDGEDPAVTAARELAEEAALTAQRWEPLIRLYNSPGYSSEQIIIYLARDLAPVDSDFVYDRVFEEAELTTHCVPLAEAAAMVDRGEVLNATTAIGILAAARRLHAA